MDRAAPTDHPIADVLTARWSPRAFAADRPVTAAQLASLFEAARWAPSSSNSQPWRFIVATAAEPDEHARLAGVLSERNRSWAKWAPVLALGVARVRAEDGTPMAFGRYDVGQAVGSLVVQATSLGLFVHQMAGYDAAAARARYAIPDDCEPVSAMAIGHLGDPARLPDRMREREGAARVRDPLGSFVFAGRFGTPAPQVR